MKKVRFISPYSNYPKAIVGEQSYQDNIKNVLGYIDDEQKRIREDGFTAELILEDDNPFDPGNAVRVDIDGETVGYLSKSDASWYRRAFAKLGLTDTVGMCGAAISGKRDSNYEDHNFGVFLDIDLKNLQVEPERAAKPIMAVKEPRTQESALKRESIVDKKDLIQSVIDIWNKGLLEKTIIVVSVLLILNFIIMVLREF